VFLVHTQVCINGASSAGRRENARTEYCTLFRLSTCNVIANHEVLSNLDGVLSLSWVTETTSLRLTKKSLPAVACTHCFVHCDGGEDVQPDVVSVIADPLNRLRYSIPFVILVQAKLSR